MAAGRYDLYIEKGATFAFSADFTRSDGSQIDLTGYTFSGQIRAFPGSPSILLTFTIAQDGFITNRINVSLTSTQTLTLPAPTSLAQPEALTQYWYDIFLTSPGLIVTRALQGAVEVSPEVTQ